MNIIQPYVPKHFGKEYYLIRGHAQYPMFMAVALGVKPCFDDGLMLIELRNSLRFVKNTICLLNLM